MKAAPELSVQPSAHMAYTGVLAAPAELRGCAEGGHVIIVRLHPWQGSLQTIIAHVPIAPTHQAHKAAELQIAQINAAAKHGANTISISAPLAKHILICHNSVITQHESHHPASAAPEKAPELEQAADLFREAA